MKLTPEYHVQKFPITFATSASTAASAKISSAGQANIIHSMVCVAHTFPVVAAAYSGASGANVKIINSDGTVVKTFAEVTSGTTTLLSADVMVGPEDVVQYVLTSDTANPRSQCLSGTGAKATETPTATLYINCY